MVQRWHNWDSDERRSEEAPQGCLINGEPFFRRHNQWVHHAVDTMPDARRVRVRFHTPEFFDLVVRHPQALACLLSARNVQLPLGNTIYEVYE